MPFARLDDRTSLTVVGEPAEQFLQTLITADLDKLADSEMRPSALLTPQGKILFDFLIGRLENGFRLDCAAAAATDLKKRLTLYKLRTKVAIDASQQGVFAIWNESSVVGALIDRRFADGAVHRTYGEPPADGAEASAEDFRALRILSAVAEAETDFPGSDVFPHDVLYDQNGGVSFKKGCFVGQEVVSRMQHRGTARRRLMLLSGEGHLTPGAAVEAGDKQIGTVLSSAGAQAMGFVRIDRLADALASDETLSADGVPVTATIPAWAGFALPETGPSMSGVAETTS